MSWSLDARIPVTLVGDAAALRAALDAPGAKPAAVIAEHAALPRAVPMRPGTAVASDPTPPPGALALAAFVPAAAGGPHTVSCACCAGRAPAAAGLDLLFQARVRGQAGWFDRVVALAGSEAARAELLGALRGDRVTTARFRLG